MKLLHFSNDSGSKEYVVIVQDDTTDPSEFAADGCTLSGLFRCDLTPMRPRDSADMLPLESVLVREQPPPMKTTTTTQPPAAGKAAHTPTLRKWRVSGLWEMFRLDCADISARNAQEAKRKFRNRYKNKRSVSNLNAYPA